MRPLILAAAAIALISGPAFAQQGRAARTPSPTAAAPTHEMCQSVMGQKMGSKQVHDHGRDKTGAPTWPNGKPLTAAEMEQMHKTCAEKMQTAGAPAKPR